eukprot:CAMPEP_0201490826 /NCGR_PEP_ID=MMETSP0151_2-20130828/27605_1 /ASSEMBLY_ACC=CAM_ASM_000257 /TAXON_ID=200890 /ORGANISM="Paramoeba atlantica, Strain 621/1 / CCAP 1560/9" /LENGTH=337 /DNA_ID=CAMNT_0047876931 /DNA_START=107 /DNA_END=1120 /DNA_ORIENTATION=+
MSSSSLVPIDVLRSGSKIPLVGLGTWQGKPGELEEAVKCAIDAGYRHFDGALVYGNEEEIGKAFQVKFKEGVLKREELFVTSKLWNSYHKAHCVLPALKESLRRLQLDYLDLYLIHWPQAYRSPPTGDLDFSMKELFPREGPIDLEKAISEPGDFAPEISYLETWKAMEELVKTGLVKDIGVSNFNSVQIEKIMKDPEVKIFPSVNQIECHPYLDQSRLIQFCRERGIHTTAYAPLGSPSSIFKTGLKPVLEDPFLASLAEKYSKNKGQILIHLQAQKGISVIPKSSNPTRIKQNIDVFDFELTEEEIENLKLQPDIRYFFTPTDVEHPDYPFSIPF